MKRKGLAVGIILLFVATGIIPSIAQDTEKPLPTSRGNTLYVGGSGPENYTRIQDAIDNASDGDTIYVYHNLSPYHENILINKSINLIGENKANTIILGDYNIAINIKSNNVKVSRFTIKISGLNSIGIYISSDFNEITDNIISESATGIQLYYASNNQIYKNLITNTTGLGIYLQVESSNNSIYKNSIKYTGGGGMLIFYSSSNNFIFRNLVEHGRGIFIWYQSNSNYIFTNSIENNSDTYDGGISLYQSNSNVIYKNNIVNNTHNGINLYWCKNNKIIRNKFQFNQEDASFFDSYFNYWFGNYWQKPRILPKIIIGWFNLEIPPVGPDIIIFKFDIHPALIPPYIPPAGCDT
jgi:parallel beta-helix repeat protein